MAVLAPGEDGIAIINTQPEQYVTVKEFCDRCQVTPGAVSQAKSAGLIRKSSLRWMRKQGQKPIALINWEAEGAAFIRRMRPEKWPQWFIKEQNPGFDPTAGGRRPKFIPPKDPDEDEEPGEMGSAAEGIYDLATAKLRKEKLAIAKADLELQQSRGLLVEVEVVGDFLRSIAIETRGTLMAMAPRLAPLLAAEKDGRKIAAIMEREISAALEPLAELERYGHGKKE